MGRPSDAKEKLLQVAFDLIWDQSYGAVSVDHICERAAVNKGSFYHFFASKSDLAIAAYEENWKEKQPELDKIFSPLIPPMERLKLWCKHVSDRQKQKAEKYGHVCGCPYASLGTELATQDEKIRNKTMELADRSIRYLESALDDVKRQNLATVNDPHTAAMWIYSLVLGFLLHAKIRNDLKLLENLHPAIMAILHGPARAA